MSHRTHFVDRARRPQGVNCQKPLMRTHACESVNAIDVICSFKSMRFGIRAGQVKAVVAIDLTLVATRGGESMRTFQMIVVSLLIDRDYVACAATTIAKPF